MHGVHPFNQSRGTNMKQTRLVKILAAGVACAAAFGIALAQETTILDPEGHTVAWSAIQPDMPATVYYTSEGDRVVVRKVILSQAAAVYETKETTTTTTKP